jgi:small subunit ribosomal protein S3
VGHKVHPNGFRLGVYRNWEAKWFAPDKEYKPLLLEDVRLRKMLLARLKNAGVARIETERSSSALTITLHTAKPGIVIGKGGTSVDQLRDELEKITGKRVRVTIQEIKKPELSAQLVAENVAAQLEKRIAFRRAIKQSLMKTMRAGAQGVKIRVKGRLGGSEMARVEWNRDGRVPLHTLKADIDFGQTEAKTTFGRIGVSAWVYTGNFPTETPPKAAVAVEEPADAGVSVGAAVGQVPAQLAELVTAAVAAPAAAAPVAEAQPAAGPSASDSARAPAKPKRAPRKTKAATEGAEAAAPKRASRPRTTSATKAAPPGPTAGPAARTSARARAPKKKE